LELADVRIAAHRWSVASIHIEDSFAVFRYTSGQKIRKLAAVSEGRLRVVDGESAYLPLDKEVAQSAAVFGGVKSLLQRE
jgi:hypothetical protein